MAAYFELQYSWERKIGGVWERFDPGEAASLDLYKHEERNQSVDTLWFHVVKEIEGQFCFRYRDMKPPGLPDDISSESRRLIEGEAFYSLEEALPMVRGFGWFDREELLLHDWTRVDGCRKKWQQEWIADFLAELKMIEPTAPVRVIYWLRWND
ncbi:hypothetical protein [Aporhodopirellula aestuarii]|uniref:Uncharacterized protein n=1 Tax=Aporhodopirellula aestuarii TaxID=2950107 RepID=A0ABT0UBY2_9BACT|nr:hypothetical protein [Aporhodopirellula aestuarii]MCM2374005.1 hypothetical protein [Aporhodopirellula aestuarii]